MSSNFLNDILEHKRQLLAAKKDYYSALVKKAHELPPPAPAIFRQRIARPGPINLIAEIKKASPSAGIIRADFDVAKIARVYADHGAAALSVLTEDKYFFGAPGHIKEALAAVELPVLTKDFIIDEAQICEARINGAQAVLLIAAILSDAQLKGFNRCAQEMGLDTLVEIHDERELDRALKCGAPTVGVNNRNLKTLEVNLKTSERLIPRVPKEKVIVAESGIKTNDDLRRVKDLGAHAVLIGETFMRARDIGRKIEEVMGC
ncbi:MAG: indole-3-glycerol phosphate synthase TrpC [Candidatus Omnitrophica bacterium]|nr:indole-3-glycerol phosphate synthase TrpC [Candidatus Omnitrophota bacterium]